MTIKNFSIAIFLIGLIVAARLLPHEANITPVVAAALVASVYLGRVWGIIVPILGILLSDIFVGFYDWKLMMAVYASFAIVGILGWWLKQNKNTIHTFSISVISSTLFFITTNFAVWTFSPWYEKSLVGLIHCYELALPFFRNMLIGDLFYVAILFGVFETVRYTSSNTQFMTIRKYYIPSIRHTVSTVMKRIFAS